MISWWRPFESVDGLLMQGRCWPRSLRPRASAPASFQLAESGSRTFESGGPRIGRPVRRNFDPAGTLVSAVRKTAAAAVLLVLLLGAGAELFAILCQQPSCCSRRQDLAVAAARSCCPAPACFESAPTGDQAILSVRTNDTKSSISAFVQDSPADASPTRPRILMAGLLSRPPSEHLFESLSILRI